MIRGALLVEESEQDRDFDDYIVRVREECPALGLGLPPEPETVAVLPVAAPAAAAAVAAGGSSLGGLGALALLPLASLALTGGDDGGGSSSSVPLQSPPSPPIPLLSPASPPPPGEEIPFNFHSGFGVLAVGLFWLRRRRKRQ